MIRGLLIRNKLRWVLIACLLVFLVLPPFVGIDILNLLTKMVIFGLLVMSLDLLVGYTGLLSFGHAAIFGMSAYSTAILVTRYGVSSFWVTAPASVLIAIIVAAIFGYVALRVSGVYFLLVTLALGEVVYHTAVRWTDLFGGSNGIVGITYPGFCHTPVTYFYFTSVVCIICVTFLYYLTKSPFGYSLQGIRENETRMKHLGYNVWLHKYIAFIIGGAIAGIAGVLYVHYSGVIAPSSVGLDATGLLWLMLIVGGVGTLWGSYTGCVLVMSIQYFVSSLTPLRWPLFLGLFFVLAVMFARTGIYSEARKLLIKITKGPAY
jgi:branched-chain amino acid transport system permease protein